MANRPLRSRTVELNEDGAEFTAGESNGYRPSDQPEVLGSADEHLEGPEIITRQVPGPEALDLEVTETNLGQRDQKLQWPTLTTCVISLPTCYQLFRTVADKCRQCSSQ
jgi:hypothetical protein